MAIRRNQSGFTGIEGMLILLVLTVIGLGGYYVWHTQKNKTSITITPAQIKQTTVSKPPTSNTAQASNQNAGNLVVKEWSLQFTIPNGLSDVQYQITKNPAPNGDGRLAIYAKPSGSDVQYRSDYMALNPNGYPLYSVGNLYRSNYATEDRPDATVAGKKIGNYYYYTDWSFSGMATGAACVALYGSSSEVNCQAASTAFQLVNQGDTALLNTIESVQ